MHGFVLLEMTGVMNGIDTDAVFTDMVVAVGGRHAKRDDGQREDSAGRTSSPGTMAALTRFDLRHRGRVLWSLVPG